MADFTNLPLVENDIAQAFSNSAFGTPVSGGFLPYTEINSWNNIGSWFSQNKSYILILGGLVLGVFLLEKKR